uniref:Putative secreted protein n=1 Tax=Panstrongylus lignarius TaxID=156445 RepID=A0A224Y648_9HEMI
MVPSHRDQVAVVLHHLLLLALQSLDALAVDRHADVRMDSVVVCLDNNNDDDKYHHHHRRRTVEAVVVYDVVYN